MAHLFDQGKPAPAAGCALSVVLEYNEIEIGDSEYCYGRVLPKGTEPLSSSYCENHKAGRVLNNRTVFVLQAAPEFSRAHADLPGDKYIPELASIHEDLWKIPAGKRTASLGHRWRSSLSVSDPAPEISLPKGAFVCGDLPSDSSVEEVWLHGRRVAADVLAHLSSS
jgi:predicted NAD/FAD-dependent oxidoreductase